MAQSERHRAEQGPKPRYHDNFIRKITIYGTISTDHNYAATKRYPSRSMSSGVCLYSTLSSSFRSRTLKPSRNLLGCRSYQPQRSYHGRIPQVQKPRVSPYSKPPYGFLSEAFATYSRPCRRFSTTSPTAHGHVTPPKPGEECAILPVLPDIRAKSGDPG